MWVSMHPRRVPTKALQTLLLRLGRQCQTAGSRSLWPRSCCNSFSLERKRQSYNFHHFHGFASYAVRHHHSINLSSDHALQLCTPTSFPMKR